MACKIHGLPNCTLPSCISTASTLCDAHLMENCHVCATVQNPRPTNPDAKIAIVVENPPKLAPPIVSDEHASRVLSAAEAYAQACQDFVAISDNAKALKANLHAALTKRAEALKAKHEAHKVLSASMKGDK